MSRTYTSPGLTRDVTRTPGGFVRVDQSIDEPGQRLATDVTGSYWILVIVWIERGLIRYLSGDEAVAVGPNPFAMWVPPRHLIQAELVGLKSVHRGIAGRDPAPVDAPTEPCVFIPPSEICPGTMDEVAAFLKGARGRVLVPRERDATRTAAKIKKAIDDRFAEAERLQDIAARLRLTPALMTRYFKQAYGMAPVEYRHHLRVVEATFLLADGMPVIEVAQAVGFQDLGRFYKKFGELVKGTPGRYKELGEK